MNGSTAGDRPYGSRSSYDGGGGNIVVQTPSRLPHCPRCHRWRARRSSLDAPLPLRLLGFHAYRCRTCFRRFISWRPFGGGDEGESVD
jgi:hypothetical protein